MKAREENGTIKVYSEIPSDWKHFLNFRQASVEVIESEGFYDVEDAPEYESVLYDLGGLYFDHDWLIFRYALIQKILPTLQQAKDAKLRELKNAVKPLYATVQWLVTMYQAEGEALPTALKDKIRLIKTRYEQAKAQINAFTTVVDVLRWQVPNETINNLKSELETYG